LLFTHGSGSRADSLDEGTYKWDGTGMLVAKYDGGSTSGVYQEVAENYIVVLPVMGTSTRQWVPSDLITVLDDVKSNYPVDASCIHTQGYSMGGKVVWFLAAEYSSTFASLTSSAGFNEFSDQQSTVTDAQMATIVDNGIGIKAFYGQWDEKQPLSTAQPLFSMLNSLGDSSASLSEIPGADHGLMSSEPWEQQSLWDWIKTQSKGSSSSSSTSTSAASSTIKKASATSTSASGGAIVLDKPSSKPRKKCKAGSSKRQRQRHRRDSIRRRHPQAGPARLESY